MDSLESNLDLPKLVGIFLNILKYMSITCFLYCLLGLGISIKKNYPLWIFPLHAEGTIVDHKEVSWQHIMDGLYIGVSTKMPVVEFYDIANTAIKFTDNTGHTSAVFGSVPVIYSSIDSRNARIDKGLLNWIDTYIWLFGTIGGLMGTIRLSNANIEEMMKKISKNPPRNDSPIA